MKPQGKKTILCPLCKAKLSFFKGDFIRITGVLRDDFYEVKAIFYLPSDLGRYGAILPEGFTLKKGAKIEFHCPECKVSLTTPSDPELAALKMIDERNAEFIVLFNKIYGKRATYVIDSTKSLSQKYGPDAENIDQNEIGKNLNYFGM